MGEIVQNKQESLTGQEPKTEELKTQEPKTAEQNLTVELLDKAQKDAYEKLIAEQKNAITKLTEELTEVKAVNLKLATTVSHDSAMHGEELIHDMFKEEK